MIYFTSDLHFNHNRDFIFQPRGFDNVAQMNEAIITNWNNVINADDDVYVLGDLMLMNNELGLQYIKNLKGKLHIVFGNHDTDIRKELYSQCYNVVEVAHAIALKYKDYHFFLSHYPTLTGNNEHTSLKQMTCNLFGHTHSKELFYENRPYMYNVALDAHNCTPIAIDQIIEDMENKMAES